MHKILKKVRAVRLLIRGTLPNHIYCNPNTYENRFGPSPLAAMVLALAIL